MDPPRRAKGSGLEFRHDVIDIRGHLHLGFGHHDVPTPAPFLLDGTLQLLGHAGLRQSRAHRFTHELSWAGQKSSLNHEPKQREKGN